MANLATALLVIRTTFIITNAVAVSGNSCQGRCGQNMVAGSCQCNTHCTRFKDCCYDYTSVCVNQNTQTTSGSSKTSCPSLASVTQQLWDQDANAFTDYDYNVNFQARVAFTNKIDKARSKLFTSVSQTKLNGPTYATFLKLLNNYEPKKGVRESKSSGESKEERDFLDAIMKTDVMHILLNYLKCKGKVTSESDLRTKLQKIWFDFYPRSRRGSPDTSGFEHVMAGEFKSDVEVNGFHNWLSFYQKENSGALEYYGHVDKKESVNLIEAAFRWNGHFKNLGSFFYGVSPEFDIAIYSLCFMLYPDGTCTAVINGQRIRIKSYSQNGHLSTIFPSV